MEAVTSQLTFDQLPATVFKLCTDIEDIKRLLQQKSEPQQPTDQWFDLTELQNYLPEDLARPTLYQKLAAGEIPGHKKGKKWFFLKSEIDNYLRSGRKKTIAEIAGEADSYLETKKKRS